MHPVIKQKGTSTSKNIVLRSIRIYTVCDLYHISPLNTINNVECDRFSTVSCLPNGPTLCARICTLVGCYLTAKITTSTIDTRTAHGWWLLISWALNPPTNLTPVDNAFGKWSGRPHYQPHSSAFAGVLVFDNQSQTGRGLAGCVYGRSGSSLGCNHRSNSRRVPCAEGYSIQYVVSYIEQTISRTYTTYDILCAAPARLCLDQQRIFASTSNERCWAFVNHALDLVEFRPHCGISKIIFQIALGRRRSTFVWNLVSHERLDIYT